MTDRNTINKGRVQQERRTRNVLKSLLDPKTERHLNADEAETIEMKETHLHLHRVPLL